MRPDIKFQLQENEYVSVGAYHQEQLKQKDLLGIESRAKLALTADVIEALNPKLVIDLGCGEGVLLEELARRRIASFGVESSDAAIQLQSPGLRRALLGDIVDLPIHSNTISLATMIAVLEHIPPDRISDGLQEIHRILEENGNLVVRVPSTHQQPKEKHYQHFTPDSLTDTLECNGLFKVNNMIGNHNMLIDWPNLLEDFHISGIQASDYSLDRVEAMYNNRLKVCDPASAKRLIAVCKRN